MATCKQQRFPRCLQAIGFLAALAPLLLTSCVAAPPSTPSAPDPLKLALNNAVHNLKEGKIAFESPVKMKLGETKVVEVRIARQLNRDLTEGLAKNGGSVEVENVEVAPFMTATLQGTAFQVTPLSAEEQAIADDRPTAWDWSVHPLDWGNQTLFLSVCVKLELKNNREERRCSPVYQRAMRVEVAPVYAATHFIANNAAWSLGALGTSASAFFGGIAWVIRRARRRKRTMSKS